MRIAVTLACVCQLRRGEVLGLERRDVNPLHKTIRVERTANQIRGELQLGPPKTEAGRRTVVIPSHVLPELEAHLAAHVGTEDSVPAPGRLYRRSAQSTGARRRLGQSQGKHRRP
jgi:integrase